MPNTLGNWNPVLYANELLLRLKTRKGLAARIHMGYDTERRVYGLGDTINIKRPATFVAVAAPGAAQALATESVAMSLGSWFEVRVPLSDKELAYTSEKIIQDHVIPTADALFDKIDQDVAALFYEVPAFRVTAAATIAVVDILSAQSKMFTNKVPTHDEANMFFMVGGAEQAALLALTEFAQYQGSGNAGTETQLSGQIGRRYGMEFFANQNRPLGAAYTNVTDSAGAVDGAFAKGVSTISIDGFAAGVEVFKKGATFTITTGGVAYSYVLTADASLAATAVSVSIAPPLRVAAVDNDVVTFDAAFDNLAASNINCAFHRGAFGLAMAKLPDYAGMASRLGLEVASIQDPDSGMAVRSRIQYMGATSSIEFVTDVLYGVKTLNPDLACRVLQPT